MLANAVRGSSAEFGGCGSSRALQRLRNCLRLVVAADPDILPALVISALLLLYRTVQRVTVRGANWIGILIALHPTNAASRRLDDHSRHRPDHRYRDCRNCLLTRLRFSSAKQSAAWIGLVPKATLERRTRANGWLEQTRRWLLAPPARAWGQGSYPMATPSECTPPSPWLAALLGRRHVNVAAAALANKNARIAWALLTHRRKHIRRQNRLFPRCRVIFDNRERCVQCLQMA